MMGLMEIDNTMAITKRVEGERFLKSKRSKIQPIT